VVAALVALSLAAAGCSADPAGTEPGSGTSTAASPESGPADDPSTSSPPRAGGTVDPAGAATALAGAVRVLRREPVTSFSAQTLGAGVVLHQTDGFVTADGWRAVTDFPGAATGQQSATMRTVSDGRTEWLQMAEWAAPRAGCWLELGPGEVPLGLSALRPAGPVYLDLVANLTPLDFVDEQREAIDATTDAVLAASLFDVQLLQQVDATALDGADVVVPVQLGYDGERVSGLAVRGADLVAALDEVGSPPPDEVRDAVSAVDVVANFPRGRPDDVTVGAPPADMRFDATERSCR
jgi:hypothetical protein